MDSQLRRELAVWADFNALDEDHRLRTSLRFSTERPSEGEWVLLYDGEGNSVKGFVEEIDGLGVRVRAEMSTWSMELGSIETPALPEVPYHGAITRG